MVCLYNQYNNRYRFEHDDRNKINSLSIFKYKDRLKSTTSWLNFNGLEMVVESEGFDSCSLHKNELGIFKFLPVDLYNGFKNAVPYLACLNLFGTCLINLTWSRDQRTNWTSFILDQSVEKDQGTKDCDN